MSTPSLATRMESLESALSNESAAERLYSRVGHLEQTTGVFNTEIASVKSDIESVNKKVDTLIGMVQTQQASTQLLTASQGRFDMKSLIMVLMAVITVGGVVWAANRTQIQADMTPMIQRLASNERVSESNSSAIATLAAKVAVSEINDGQSMTDRNRLNAFDERQTASNARVDNKLTELQAAFVESETQQRANSQIRNLMVDHTTQLLSILWEEVKKSPLPKNGYFPDISLPKPAQLK